jgi:ATP/ADP translocase
VWAFAAAAKFASKVFDYSLFRAAKELLYIRLSRAERSQGKAVVDMLTYRSAKAGAAALVGVLVAVAPAEGVTLLALGLLAAWGLLAGIVSRRYARTPA